MTHQDPTREEILSYLANYEGDEFDKEEAIYWFANDWHGGQWSNLYSVLSTSEYRPGPMTNGPESGSMSELLKLELEIQFMNEPVEQD